MNHHNEKKMGSKTPDNSIAVSSDVVLYLQEYKRSITDKKKLIINDQSKVETNNSRVPRHLEETIYSIDETKNDSVGSLRLVGDNMDESEAKDIARVIRKSGKIIIYGNSITYLNQLKKALKVANKNIFLYKNYQGYEVQELIDSTTLGKVKAKYIFMPESTLISDFSLYISEFNYEKAYDVISSLNEAESNQIYQTIDSLLNNKSSCNAIFYFFVSLFFDKNEKSFINKYLPDIYNKIFSGDFINIRNIRYFAGLKLGKKADSNGDYIAYGGRANNERLSWRFEFASWDADKKEPYFYIINKEISDAKLKLGESADKDGDHNVYGSSNGRDLWKLELFDCFSFYIFNVTNKKYLKLGKSIDLDNDRTAYGTESPTDAWHLGKFYF